MEIRRSISTPLHRLEWQRRDQAILSAMTTNQDWCRVQLYNPTVIRVGDRYRMWYLGNSTATRTADMNLGVAESADGLRWTEYLENPILTESDLPFGNAWQTPHVLFDVDENLYKMWFIMLAGRRSAEGSLVDIDQKLGYATSLDGLSWDVHPEPIFRDGRRPFVMKDGPNAYRMWMCSSPHPEGDFGDLVSHIYRFVSSDGLNWTRDPEPMLSATKTHRSVIYPCVLQDESGYTMWYGCHVEGAFEIFCSTSVDGLRWTHYLDRPAFSATRDPNDFDGRFTSTPCVLDDGDRYLMYYCTRDCGNLYRAGDGTIMFDRAGIYRHIGVAVCPKE